MAFKFSQSDLNAINAAKAIRDYNDAEASLAARSLANQQAQSKQKQGGLGGVLQGIGESIGNVGRSFMDVFGMPIANIKDVIAGKNVDAESSESQKYKKFLWGGENAKDRYLRAGGGGLDAAATVSDLIPGLGKAAKVALNVGQGVASGVGSQFANNGTNTRLEDVLQSATIGAASAGAGQLVGGKLANRAAANPAKTIIGKAAQSGIGRSALTGAASGAVGGGLATALQGGDFGQTLQGALEGAGQGALGGATTGAVYGLAGTALDKVNNKILNGKKSGNQIPTNVMADTQEELPEATKKRQQATNWKDEQIDASKRNTLQKIGKVLQDTGEITENNDIYGRLNNNTARDVQKRGTIKKLKNEYGYTSADYDKAAELSTAVNHYVQREAEMSGASGFDNNLVSRVSVSADDVPEMKQKTLNTYRNKSQQLLQGALVEGGSPDEYSVAGLYKGAETAGDLAKTYYEKSHNKMDGSVSDPELDALSKSYSKLKNEMRTTADNLLGGDIDEITRNNLRAMLKNSGAPEQAVKTLSEAKNFKDLIRRTSPLEAARNMYEQMGQVQLKRGATTDTTKVNVLNEAIRASGAPQLAKAAVTPVGQAVGKIEQGVGKFISAVGDKTGDNAPKAVKAATNLVKAANNGLNVGDADYGFSDTVGKTKLTRKIRKTFSGNDPLTVGDLATRVISREAGQTAANDVKVAREQAEAQRALNEAQAGYNTALANYQNTMAQAQAAQAQNSEGAQKLQQISDAMEAALAAGDITSYSKLADLYSTAYKIYGKELEAAQAAANPLSNLSSTQLENVNKLDTASNAIDELESLFQKAGGGQGLIGGNAANLMASLGMNSDVATYNSLSRGLINQIGAAIGKTDSLNTEGEVNRALELIPKFTDDAQTAANKLEQLRQMLTTNKQTVYKNYGLTS